MHPLDKNFEETLARTMLNLTRDVIEVTGMNIVPAATPRLPQTPFVIAHAMINAAAQAINADEAKTEAMQDAAASAVLHAGLAERAIASYALARRPNLLRDAGLAHVSAEDVEERIMMAAVREVAEFKTWRGANKRRARAAASAKLAELTAT